MRTINTELKETVIIRGFNNMLTLDTFILLKKKKKSTIHGLLHWYSTGAKR